MKKISAITITACALLLAGCNMPPPKPQMTPLQIQAMQTKSFKADKRKAFNATMQVFQDLGYTVDSANFNTGFISAKSMTKNTADQMPGFVRFLNAVNSNNGQQQSVSGFTKATAFVSQAPNKEVRIRVSFVDVTKTSTNGGSPVENDQQILSPGTYDNMFNRIRQALFVGTASA